MNDFEVLLELLDKNNNNNIDDINYEKPKQTKQTKQPTQLKKIKKKDTKNHKINDFYIAYKNKIREDAKRRVNELIDDIRQKYKNKN